MVAITSRLTPPSIPLLVQPAIDKKNFRIDESLLKKKTIIIGTIAAGALAIVAAVFHSITLGLIAITCPLWVMMLERWRAKHHLDKIVIDHYKKKETISEVARRYLQKNPGVLKKLLDQGETPNKFSVEGKTLLHGMYHLPTINFLLKHGARVDLKHGARSPLEEAIYIGNFAVIYHLFDQQPNEARNHSADSLWKALAQSRSKNPEQIAQFLLDQGYSLESFDEQGFTPLLHACRYGSIGLSRTLLSLEANLETKQLDTGNSALHVCSHPDLVELLIRSGVDKEAKNIRGLTPFQYHLIFNALSLDTTLDPENETRIADSSFMIEEKENLIHGLDVLESLIQAGCDINSTIESNGLTADGETPLTFVIKLALKLGYQGDIKTIIDLLIDNGADLTIANKQDQTPLDLVEKMIGLSGGQELLHKIHEKMGLIHRK